VLDVEFTQVLRRLVRERAMQAGRAEQAILDLANLRITRYPHFVFLPRIWELRHNLTAYDAVYIALTERLNATLLTRDARLSAAGGHRARIEVF
jgi:predicted nucleic acid-binding protein